MTDSTPARARNTSAQNHINRPWFTSFSFHNAVYSDKRLEQVHKLTRNFVVSLDLGCPSAKHVATISTQTELWDQAYLFTDRERYLLWVKQWKQIYARLSTQIRILKSWRRTIRLDLKGHHEQLLRVMASIGTNSSKGSYANSLAALHLPRLQETAQVMLNARYNAKLASAERRRRHLEKFHADLEALKANTFADAAMSATGGEGVYGEEAMEAMEAMLNESITLPTEPSGDYRYDTNDKHPLFR